MAEKKYFRIQDLDPMLSTDLDNEDLFLMTDVSNNSNKSSRSLKFGTLSTVINAALNQSLTEKITEPVTETVYQRVEPTIDSRVDSKVNYELKNNINEYATILNFVHPIEERTEKIDLTFDCGNSVD